MNQSVLVQKGQSAGYTGQLFVGASKGREDRACSNGLTKVNRQISGFLFRYSMMLPFSYRGNTRQKSATAADTP